MLCVARTRWQPSWPTLGVVLLSGLGCRYSLAGHLVVHAGHDASGAAATLNGSSWAVDHGSSRTVSPCHTAPSTVSLLAPCSSPTTACAYSSLCHTGCLLDKGAQSTTLWPCTRELQQAAAPYIRDSGRCFFAMELHHWASQHPRQSRRRPAGPGLRRPASSWPGPIHEARLERRLERGQRLQLGF